MKQLFYLLLNIFMYGTFDIAKGNPFSPVTDPPVITITGNTNICYGSATTLTASGALTYSWTTGLPLDGLSTATLAVGLRKLKTSYTGFALQLRRASDNTTMDFGFSGSNLDTAAISTFLSGSNGYCSILYDQSGAGTNVTQPANANQPLYVANGQNGKPVLRFNTSQFMQNPTNFGIPYSVVYAARQTGPVRSRVLSSVANNWLLGWWGGSKDQAYFEGWVSNIGTPAADNNAAVYSASGSGTGSSVYRNGSLLFNNTNGTAAPNGIQLNGSGAFGEQSDCEFMDVMIFNSVLSNAERFILENSIQSYYNIGDGGSQITVSPLSTTTYTVTGTDADGQSSTASVTVNVRPNHSITPADAAMICIGGSKILTASAGSSWLWSTGETTQSISVDTAGLFSVQVDNCPASNTVQTYIAAVAPANPSLCNGQVTLTGSGPTPLTSFNWTGSSDFDNQTRPVPLSMGVTSFKIALGTSAFAHSHGGVSVNVKIELFNPNTNAWINIYDANTTGQINFGGLIISFPIISHVSEIRFLSTPGQAQTFHNFFGTLMSMTSVNDFSYLWNNGDTTQSINVTTTGTFSVSIEGCAPVFATVSPIVGNPAVFGSNTWNVYAWNAGDGVNPNTSWNTNYAGFYVENNLSFNTLDRWTLLGSPSDASGYSGCSVNADNHSWSAKRQGFPCSYYQVDIPGHDDATQLFINGVKVFEHIGCCDAHTNVWRGYLNATSTVEFRATEGGGGSSGSIDIIPMIGLTCTADIIVNIPAGQCSATVTLTPPTATDSCSIVTITNDHPSATFNAGLTFVTWTATNAAGDSATCVSKVKVIEPVAPVITCPASVTVSSTPDVCGAIVNISPTVTDNCSGISVAVHEFNYRGDIETFVVPLGVTSLNIAAIGAAGGANGNIQAGKGASMSGDFAVIPGETLYLLVGEQGGAGTDLLNAGGGGGGTFVTKDPALVSQLLLAAGGGGGAGIGGVSNANIGTNGFDGGDAGYNGAGYAGFNGSGGSTSFGGGGGGWLGNGYYPYSCFNIGLSPFNGGNGGIACGGGKGGYGGGGGADHGAGGGGGYSGGGGGDINGYSNNHGLYGGGGGSYNSGTNPVNTAGIGAGNGKVIIKFLAQHPIITLTNGIRSGAVFPIGTTLNTWTARDASGNTSICSASITVLDNETPALTCPANISVNVGAGQCTALVNYATPGVEDNCCPTLISHPDYTYFGIFGGHTYFLSDGILSWTAARDAAFAAGGKLVSINSAAENSFLTNALGSTSPWVGGFQNHLNPNFSEPGGGWEWVDGTPFTYTNWSLGEPNNSGGEDHLQFYSGGKWNDLFGTAAAQYVVEFSCGITPVRISGPASGTAFPIGTTTVTWKATDGAGNSDTCSFNITVTDNANPGVSVDPITGGSTVCIGTPSQMSNTTAGGIWSSSNTAIATVNSNGLVTGVAPGSATIIYKVNLSGCDRVVYKPISVYGVASMSSATISGIVNVCSHVGTGITLTYTVTNAISASSYLWTVPPTVSILSGQGTSSITVTINNGFVTNANKAIKVKGISVCGNSPDKVFYLVAQLPGTPSPITGPTNICTFLGTSTAAIYKIPRVIGAASYIWTTQSGTTVTHPNGPGAFDTVIHVTYAAGFTTSPVTVQTTNDCGTSAARSLMIVRNPAATPGLITGPTNACAHILPGGTAATYSIVAVAGATFYTWSAPAGAIITHTNPPGSNDLSITVKYPNGFTSGTITVTATNGCGTSGIRSLAISKLNPATPGVIDVIQTSACPNRIYSYTISSMPANATSILWTIPDDAISFTGQGTTSITVSYPPASVTDIVTATAVNNCARSVTRISLIKLPACPPPAFGRGTGKNETAITKTEKNQPLKLEVTVMPNPSVDNFRLKVKGLSKEQIHVRIIDALGRILNNITMMPNETISFGSQLRSGSYMIEVTQGESKFIQRLVKL